MCMFTVGIIVDRISVIMPKSKFVGLNINSNNRKKNMELIEPIYIPSLPVTAWLSVKEQAEELEQFILDNDLKVFAIHHMQVCEKPFNFFVLNKKAVGTVIEELGSQYIINPTITNYLTGQGGAPIFMKMKEGCASFPYKSFKNVERSPLITVKYQIPDACCKFNRQTTGDLIEKTMQVEGLVAQIFQHEIDHGHGRNIYYDNPKPVQSRVPTKGNV